MFNTAIIGLGNIAQGWDKPDNEFVFTHIKGFQKNGQFPIVAIYDLDNKKAEDVSRKWKIDTIISDFNDLKKIKPDIISICTPDITHSEVIRNAIELKPKLIFCEKPLGTDINESEILLKKVDENGIKLCVNYSRRFLPEVMKLQEDILNLVFGHILSTRIKYYKGFFHNASHAIDLISAFLKPDIFSGAILSEIEDYSVTDKTISAAVKMRSKFGDFNLMIEGYDGRKNSSFEIEFVFEKKMINITEKDGMYLTFSDLKENMHYPGYFEFTESKCTKVKSENAMKNAIQDIYNSLVNNKELISNGNTALETLNLCKTIYSLNKI